MIYWWAILSSVWYSFFVNLMEKLVGHPGIFLSCSPNQWHSQYGGKGGRVSPLAAKNLPKIGKIVKNQEKVEKSGKNRTKEEKLGRKSKNQEGSLCPSWQIGQLATLLVQICACIQTFVNFCF